MPEPPEGYVVSLIHFHELGVDASTHDFFHVLVHRYGVELQHLNPNGVQHVSAFVVLCEGFLSIAPNFALWCHFFSASQHQCRIGKNDWVPAAVSFMGTISSHQMLHPTHGTTTSGRSQRIPGM